MTVRARRTWSTARSASVGLALCAAVAGCGDDDATPAPTDAGLDAALDAAIRMDAQLDSAIPDSGIDHEPSAREGADALVTLQLGVALADSLFDFDATIDPAATAADNAAAIGTNVRANLGGCGSAVVSAMSVSVDFGAAPGCSLATGVAASGTVAVAVSRSAATTVVAVDLSRVTVQGRDLAGTLTFTTTDGRSFMATATGGTATGLLTVAGGAGTFTVDGTLTVGASTTPTGVTFMAVVWHRGDCYPSGGSVRITHGFLMQTLAFTASTAATGTCERTVVGRTTSYMLPAYGACPPGGMPDAGLDAGLDAGMVADAQVDAAPPVDPDAASADAGP